MGHRKKTEKLAVHYNQQAYDKLQKNAGVW